MARFRSLLWLPILLFILGGEAVHAGNPQTINWWLPSPVTYTNQPIAFRAIASSGLPVTVQIINGPGSLLFEPVNRPPYGTNWTGQLVMTGAGTITLRAEQAGNDDHLPVVSERTVVVSKASQRLTVTPLDATFVALIDTPYPAGFFATASSGLTPVLAVTSGPAMVVSNSMIVTNVGLVTISLSQPGNADFTPATPVTRQFNNRSEIEITQVGAAPHPKAGMGPSFFGSTLHQGFAYLAQGTNGIAVVDFNEAGKPRYVTNAPAGGRALQLAIHRNVALVACGTDGVSVLDVSNPRLPNLVSGLKSIGNITEVESAGDFVVARDTGTGLVILDVSTPLVPRVRGRYAVPGGIGVLTAQSNIVGVTTTNRLILVDIGNPESPVVANTVLLPEAPTVAKLHGGYAYVGGPTLGLLTVRLGDLRAPAIIQTNAIEGVLASLAVGGSTLVTLSQARQLQVFRVDRDGLLEAIATERVPATVAQSFTRIHLANDLVMCSGLGGTLVGVADRDSSVRWHSAYRSAGYGLLDVERDGGLAIASDGASAFLFDVTDPRIPRLVAEMEEGSIGAIALGRGHAYLLSDTSGLLTFDVSTLSSPVMTARHPLGSFRGRRLKLNGTQAWLLGLDADGPVAHLFDLANPGMPTPISSYRATEGSGRYYSDVAFGSGWVVFGGWPGDFEIVDTSVPNDLRLIRRSPVRSPDSICLVGETLLGGSSGRLDIYRISSDSSVSWRGYYPLATQAGRIEYRGGYLLHNQRRQPNGIIQVATISTVTNSSLLNQGLAVMKDFVTAGIAWDFAADEESIVVADGNAGLVVLEYREGVKPVIRSSLPPRVSRTNGPIDLASAVRGTVPLTYSVVSGPAMISEGRLHLTGAGRVVVQAESPGTQQFFSVTNRWSIDVAAVQQSITWSSPPIGILRWDEPVPLMASASSGLPVTFRVEFGPAFITNGVVTVTNAGTVSLVAEQPGNDIYEPVTRRRVFNPRELRFEPIGSWPGVNRGEALDVAVVGDRAYVAFESGGIGILDVSQPSTPLWLGGHDIYGAEAEGIRVRDGRAYVANNLRGLVVLDVSDPRAVQILGNYDTAGSSQALELVGNVAYVADGNGGLQILDVGNPGAIQRLGGFTETGFVRYVRVVGSHAYLADDKNGLLVLNVSDASNPVLIGRMAVQGVVSSSEIAGTRAYLAIGSAGVQVVDIGSPASPTALGRYDTSGYAYGVQVVGDLAYVADAEAGIQVLDVSGSGTPTRIGGFQTGGRAKKLQVVGGLAYVAAGSKGLQIVDVGKPNALVRVGPVETRGYAADLHVVGSLAYLADSAAGLLVVDVSDPTAPVRLGGIEAMDSVRGVRVAGGFAYLADGTAGLQVVDVRNPAAPSRVGRFDTAGLASGVQVAGDLAYVADGAAGLQIVNVGNPAAPVRVGGLDTPGTALEVQVVGDLAYVADGSAGLQILDVSNPVRPARVGGFDTPGTATGVQVVGHLAYVADGESGIQVVDISNPAVPSLVISFDTPGLASSVSVVGTHAYIGDRGGGLQVLDLSQPVSPSLGSTGTPRGSANAVQVVDDLAYVADGESGLQIIRVGEESRIAQYVLFLPPESVNLSQSPITLEAFSILGFPITYRVVSGPGTVDGSVLTLTGVGSVVVRAEHAGNQQFLPVTEERVITVLPAPIPPRLGETAVTAGGILRLNLEGPQGAVAILEFSPDLREWIPISTNSLPRQLELPLPVGSAAGFYRTVVR